ncbi:hypothetical protein [Streptococcus equi]|uniref:hypothetical protein n=1 Tax=Streptococcus equi TaxID=1336 RepID=UPI001E519663
MWFFSDNQNDPDAYLQPSEKLTQEERAAFNSLVEEGKKQENLKILRVTTH